MTDIIVNRKSFFLIYTGIREINPMMVRAPSRTIPIKFKKSAFPISANHPHHRGIRASST
jgi:hypothetical protein